MKYDPHEQLQRFRKGTPAEQQAARSVLLEMGAHAVPYVLDAMDSYSDTQKRVFFLPDRLWRLAELLVDLGDPRGLVPLLGLAQQSRDVRMRLLTGRLFELMEQRGTPTDTETLLAVLAHIPPTGDQIRAAQALAEIAERHPTPQLRAALPLLEFGVHTPIAFAGLQRRLRKALAGLALPIPAAPCSTNADLPIPLKEDIKEIE